MEVTLDSTREIRYMTIEFTITLQQFSNIALKFKNLEEALLITRLLQAVDGMFGKARTEAIAKS